MPVAEILPAGAGVTLPGGASLPVAGGENLPAVASLPAGAKAKVQARAGAKGGVWVEVRRFRPTARSPRVNGP